MLIMLKGEGIQWILGEGWGILITLPSSDLLPWKRRRAHVVSGIQGKEQHIRQDTNTFPLKGFEHETSGRQDVHGKTSTVAPESHISSPLHRSAGKTRAFLQHL